MRVYKLTVQDWYKMNVESRDKFKIMLAAALIAVSAFAVLTIASDSSDADLGAFVKDGITYSVISDSPSDRRVSAFSSDSTAVSLVIPETVEWNSLTYTVTEVGERGFSGLKTITSVSLPPSMRILGAAAFEECTSLKSIVIPQGVVKLDEWVFKECTKLESVTIPASTKIVGDMAFYGCSSPELRFSVDKGNTSYYSTRDGLLISKDMNMMVIGRNIETPVIPGNITAIGEWAFYGFNNVKTVVIPNGVRFIGYSAFEECSSLTSVTIPKSIEVIGEYAFQGCTDSKLVFTVDPENAYYYANDGSLFSKRTLSMMHSRNSDKATIPEGVKYIGSGAFFNCNMPVAVTIPSGVETIGAFAFYGCTSLVSVKIPSSVKKIEDSAFDGCTSLTSIEIPDSVKSIGRSAFEGCTSLTDIKLSSSLKMLENSVFKNCAAVSSIELPESTLVIGRSAFEGCTALKNIVIPPGVCSVEEKVFKDCPSVTSITFIGTIPAIGTDAFAIGLDGAAASVTVYTSKENTVLETSTKQYAGNTKMSFHKDCALKLENVKGGKIEISDTSNNLPIGSKVRVTVTPDEGYRYVGLLVNGDIVTTESTCDLNIYSDATVSAMFESTASVDTVIIAAIVLVICAVTIVAVLAVRHRKAKA